MPTTQKAAAGATKAAPKRAKKAASSTKSTSPSKGGAKKRPSPAPGGGSRPAATFNPHFFVDRALSLKVDEKGAEVGIKVADVLRFGLARYAKGYDPEASGPVFDDSLPEAAMKDLKAAWKSNDDHYLNAYLAALVAAGWAYSDLAEATMACGGKAKISRQAIHLRVKKAPTEPPPLPEVPVARKPMNKRAPGSSPETRDLSFRVALDIHEAAAARAKRDGESITSVLEKAMEDFVSGRVSVEEISSLVSIASALPPQQDD